MRGWGDEMMGIEERHICRSSVHDFVSPTFLTSAKPEVTAERVTKAYDFALPISLASVVLPHPGGPHSMLDCIDSISIISLSKLATFP